MTTIDLATANIPALRAYATELGVDVPAKIKRADIVALIEDAVTPATPADMFTDEGEYGAADIAAKLDMDAYDLRVILRELGYGVGKGRKYAFDMGDANNALRAVRNVLATRPADDATPDAEPTA